MSSTCCWSSTFTTCAVFVLILLTERGLDARDACNNTLKCGCCETNECEGGDDSCGQCKDGYTGKDCSQLCPFSCLRCSKEYWGNEISCDICQDGYYNGHPNDDIEYEERKNCNLKCRDGCELCTSYLNCTRCKVGYYKSSANECLKCSRYCNRCSTKSECKDCVEGYYLTGNQCQICNEICRTCSLRTECTSCYNGFYLKEQTCKACPSECESCYNITSCHNCRNGYYNKQGMCSECSDNCVDCYAGLQSKYTCRKCKDGYFSTNGSCHKCSQWCVACESETKCLECENEYELYDGRCMECPPFCQSCITFYNCSRCLSGFYNDNGLCKRCPGNCIDCSSEKTCFSCIEGFYGQSCSYSCSEVCTSTFCNTTFDNCDKCIIEALDLELKQCSHCSKECVICQPKCSCPENCVCNATGACVSCQDGYTGETCSITCSKGCAEGRCSKETGDCLAGCVSGVSGRNCSAEVKYGASETSRIWVNIIPLGIGLGSAVLLFTSICTLRVFLRRRKLRNHKREVQELPIYQREGIRLCKESDLEEIDGCRPEVPSFDRLSDAVGDEFRGRNVNKIQKIMLHKFADYVLTKTSTDYVNEFQALPNYLTKSHKASQKKGNVEKNRYKGIYPYDDCRVVLKTGASDYINASFINGYKKRRAYIASVGPTEKYMGDLSVFWRMVWQERCGKIVMLNNLSESKVNRCDQYWPERDYFNMFAEFTISALTEETYVNYTVRSFEIQMNTEKRIVKQFHFTTWPENGVPVEEASFVEFCQEVNAARSDLDGPTLVHCSAGVGRTGTYIALDILTKEGEVDGQLDIYSCIRSLREQRVSMLQTIEQYEYLHRCLVHSLTHYTQLCNVIPKQTESTQRKLIQGEMTTYTSLIHTDN